VIRQEPVAVADDEPVVAEPVAEEPVQSPVVETRKNKD
jgi:hypothetical protein